MQSVVGSAFVVWALVECTYVVAVQSVVGSPFVVWALVECTYVVCLRALWSNCPLIVAAH